MKCFSFPVYAFIHSTDAYYVLSSLSGTENVAVNFRQVLASGSFEQQHALPRVRNGQSKGQEGLTPYLFIILSNRRSVHYSLKQAFTVLDPVQFSAP